MAKNTTLPQNKDFAIARIKKKIHTISDKSLIVIDDSLVKLLSINKDSWCEQQPVSGGILVKICSSDGSPSKGET